MQDMNAKINQGMRAMVEELNRHTDTVARARLAYDKATDQDEKAALIAKIAASGVALAKAWSGMIMMGQLGSMLGLDPRQVIDAQSTERDDSEAN